MRTQQTKCTVSQHSAAQSDHSGHERTVQRAATDHNGPPLPCLIDLHTHGPSYTKRHRDTNHSVSGCWCCFLRVWNVGCVGHTRSLPQPHCSIALIDYCSLPPIWEWATLGVEVSGPSPLRTSFKSRSSYRAAATVRHCSAPTNAASLDGVQRWP